ncbi:UNVERIFIED_CONTAM: UDP-galactose/UDP-glucose transporter 7 [Trichonephila clavipes]
MKQSNGNYTVIQIAEHKSNKKHYKAYLQNFESIGSAVLYGICSTSMAFANKTIITSYSFDFPFFIMACQMMLCILFLETLRINSIVFIPKYSMKLGRSFFWPAMFYAIHSVTALYALGGMSIPMYVAVKRCAPIVTLILSIVVLKKAIPSMRIILAVVLISFGCILASLGDLEFDMITYMYGALSVLVQGLYLTLAQKSLEDMSALLVLYITSYNTIPIFIIISFLHEAEGIAQYENFSDFGFILCFIIQVVTGVLLNYSLFLCTAKNSALTTSLVGVLKSILQTVIGFFTFGGVKFNSLNIFGISLNMFGGIMYSYAKYNERLKSNALNNVKPI